MKHTSVESLGSGAGTLEHVQAACRAAEFDLQGNVYDELPNGIRRVGTWTDYF